MIRQKIFLGVCLPSGNWEEHSGVSFGLYRNNIGYDPYTKIFSGALGFMEMDSYFYFYVGLVPIIHIWKKEKLTLPWNWDTPFQWLSYSYDILQGTMNQRMPERDRRTAAWPSPLASWTLSCMRKGGGVETLRRRQGRELPYAECWELR